MITALAAAAGAHGAVLEPIRDPRATIWAVGDATDPGAGSTRVAGLITGARPDRFLYLGDVYEDGTAAEFADNYGARYGALDAIAAPTPGNHEWPNRAQGYLAYWGAAEDQPMPEYYSFRVGRWQVLSLNSEARHDAGSAQVRWLERRLRRGSRFGDCRIAFWHRPLLSAAHGHGDQPDITPLWDALAGHARLVLNGHDHTLQRLRPSDGITELIAGAGGRPRHPIDRSDPRPRFADDAHDGALRLRLRGEVARIAFVATSGELIDTSRARCRRD